MAGNHSTARDRHAAQGQQRDSRRRVERWRQPDPNLRHGIDLGTYLNELADLRVDARENLPAAGERALKVLERFLANLARALGYHDDRISMGDSIRYLERISGVPRDIALGAERFRDTRNALAHNSDLMLRPESATRVIDAAETLVRMAAEQVRDLSRSRLVTTTTSEPLATARDRLLEARYDQLVVVDATGGVVDLLTDRDIVLSEALEDIDGGDVVVTVADALARRGHPAVALLPAASSAAEAVDALKDDAVTAVVITTHGRAGEPPLGIITRKDVLRAV